MKVNPVGIQTYQHLAHQEKTPASSTEKSANEAAERKVMIESRSPLEKPAVAVKGPSGDYSQYLSGEERQALDLLFTRFKDGSRFGPGYQTDNNNTDRENALGRVVDIKV